ncbi:MAG TPA: RluA family pseudouridine synthase [Parvularculaceae bacterium]|nr:RluA family pseudouridine synthase [Parvularculaceae bacterium]
MIDRTHKDRPAQFTVPQDYAGTRLDKWLSEIEPAFSRSRFKALIEQGALSRNGTAFTDPSWKIRVGEVFEFAPPPVEPAVPKPEAIALDIFYEDDDIIVVNKPAGMVVHPAAGNWNGTLVNALIAHCGASLSGVGGVARPGIVHRLDKDTSGLLVAAKRDASHAKLSEAFSAHDIERVYDALVVGAPRPAVGTVDAPLARAGGDRKKMAVVDEDDARPDQRRAVTHYRLVEAYGRGRAKLAGDALAALIECRLETGRTHQIRVHMASIGCPLIGDPVYGRGPGLSGLKPGDAAADTAIAAIKGFRRQALHARILGFNHPISGKALRFASPAPEDFRTLADALRAL